MNRRVYIATCLEFADVARKLAAMLTEANHEITSTWHATDHSRSAEASLERYIKQAIADKNRRDIARANTLVMIWNERCRGTYVEYGMAWSMGHKIVVVADPTDTKMTCMVDQPRTIFVSQIEMVSREL